MARAVVVAEFVVLCDDDHLVAAAGDDPVHTLETGVRFDVLAVRIEQVEPVVRADPEKRVRRHGDLLDEVARQGGIFAPVVREEAHAFAVPHVQPVARTDPDEPVFILCQREDGIVRYAFAARYLPQVAGLCCRTAQQVYTDQVDYSFHGGLRFVEILCWLCKFMQIFS